MIISFRGLIANETDHNPNPFLDYRLQVMFTDPSGQHYNIPGFFAGDEYGNAEGDVWKVCFSPDELGKWQYEAFFRQGEQVAVSLDSSSGQATFLRPFLSNIISVSKSLFRDNASDNWCFKSRITCLKPSYSFLDMVIVFSIFQRNSIK